MVSQWSLDSGEGDWMKRMVEICTEGLRRGGLLLSSDSGAGGE